MDWYNVYTETSSQFACAESSRSSQTELAVLWLSSFSIFPTRLRELQLLMSRLQQQFLRSQHDKAVQDFPMRNKLATYRKYHNEQVFSFLLPILYSVSFQDYYPHQTCSFTSLNLEVIWRRPTLRKETQSRNEELEVSNTPQSILPSIPMTVQPSVLLQSVDQYWQLEPLAPLPWLKHIK